MGINKNCFTTTFYRCFIFFIPFAALLFLCTMDAFSADSPGTVRFAHITDVHLNPRRGDSKGRMVSHSLELLEDAVEQINDMKEIDFVVFTGDMVDGPDEKLLALFTQEANKLHVPWYWTTGNHDLAPDGTRRDRLLAVMNADNPYIQPQKTCYSFSTKGFLFFSMDGTIDTEITAQGLFSKECLTFLDRRLSENADTPAVIFQHFPLVYPYSSASHSVRNQREYLDIIETHSSVKALFTGHFHAARINEKNGVLHVSSPVLVEYPNAFRLVTIEKTVNGFVFNIQTIETRLKAVQDQSMSKAPAALNAGKDSDRNLRVTIP